MSSLLYGRRVHDEIGYHFLKRYPRAVGGYYDRRINTILKTKVKWWGWNRPDLVYKPTGSKKGEVWEIKPLGQYLPGSAQLGWYLMLLNSNDPEGRKWIPDTSYIPPSVVTIDPVTIAIITPSINGVIQYQVIDMKTITAAVSLYAMTQIKTDLAIVQLRMVALRVPF